MGRGWEKEVKGLGSGDKGQRREGCGRGGQREGGEKKVGYFGDERVGKAMCGREVEQNERWGGERRVVWRRGCGHGEREWRGGVR